MAVFQARGPMTLPYGPLISEKLEKARSRWRRRQGKATAAKTDRNEKLQALRRSARRNANNEELHGTDGD